MRHKDPSSMPVIADGFLKWKRTHRIAAAIEWR